MVVSGENFILTPKVDDATFVFDGLTLSDDGVAGIGFSGGGHESIFVFSGKRLIDPEGDYVYSYEPGIPIKISGDIKLGSTYRYSIDDHLVGDGRARPLYFTTEKLLIRTTGCYLNADVWLYSPEIGHEVTFSPTFLAGQEISGTVKNNSDIEFTILASYFSETNTAPNLTGEVTGKVPAHSNLDFTLTDVSDSYSDSNAPLNSTLNLQTTFGLITKRVASQRASGFERGFLDLSTVKSSASSIAPYFSGSGNAEIFTWLPYSEQYEEHSILYEKRDSDGHLVDKNLRIRLENVSPETGAKYTGTYVTSFFTYFSGHDYCLTGQACSNTQYTTRTTCEAAGTCADSNCTTQPTCVGNGAGECDSTWTYETWTDYIRPIWQCTGDMPGSGRYTEIPDVEFITFSQVTGVNFNTNNLFTKDTPAKLPMLFSGYPGELGTGATGYFLTEDFEIDITNYLPGMHSDNTPDGEDVSNWKRITGIELTNFGTGYTKMPAIFAATGMGVDPNEDNDWDDTAVGGTGYDIGKRREPYVHRALKAEAVGQLQAAYLTGLPYFQQTGDVYLFSGILITNVGSGFDATDYVPYLRVTRDPNDALGSNDGDDCSGEFLFNTSGTLYEFLNHWDLETGSLEEGGGPAVRFNENNLILSGQYSGSADLPALHKSFFVRTYFQNTDIDEPIVSKLTVEGENYVMNDYFITGKNLLSTATGYGYPVSVLESDGENLYNKTYFGS